jgi:hypothetical protein
MDKSLINRLNEINRLMSYNRSKTLLEQTNDYDLSNIDNQQHGYQDRFANNRYNPIQNAIDEVGIDAWIKARNRDERMRYKGDKKPTEPTPARGEGYYLDGEGNHRAPNGYWWISYNSPRYKEYYKDIIQPMLNLNNTENPNQAGMPPFILLKGKYKEEVWDIYEKDLDDWERTHLSDLRGFHHIFLPLASIVVGIATGGVGGIVLAGLIEAADAYLYYKEGDTTSAALTTIFMSIPGGMLISKIPGVEKLIKEVGEGAIGALLKKLYNKLPLNAAERKVVNEIAEHQDELYKLAARYTIIAEKAAALMEMGLRGTVILLLHLARLPIFTLKWTIRIGGVLFTGNELLYRLTQYYDIKWEEHWGPKPTLTEEQLAVPDDVLVKAEEELTERATSQINAINESEEATIIEVEKVLNSFDVSQYVIE